MRSELIAMLLSLQRLRRAARRESASLAACRDDADQLVCKHATETSGLSLCAGGVIQPAVLSRVARSI